MILQTCIIFPHAKKQVRKGLVINQIFYLQNFGERESDKNELCFNQSILHQVQIDKIKINFCLQ